MKRAVPFIALGAVFLSLSTPAMAYLDGATGSMLLQAVIGGVASAAMFGRHYLAKAKALFRGKAKAPKNDA